MPRQRTQYEINRLLATDHEKVLDAEMPELERKIVTYEASVDDVHNWYGTEDPIREAFLKKQLVGLAGDYQGDTLSRGHAVMNMSRSFQTYAAIANTLLVDIVDPDTDAMLEFQTSIRGEEDETFQTKWIDTSKTVGYLLSQLSPEDLNNRADDLLIVLDSLATCAARSAQFREYEISRVDQATNRQIKREADDEADSWDEVSNGYYEQTFQLAESLHTLVRSPDDNLRHIGLKSTLFEGALGLTLATVNEYNHPSAETAAIKKRVVRDAVEQSVDAINNCFVIPNTGNKVVKGSAKGALHEAVYLVDMIFLLGTDQKYKDWQITPATLKNDSPKLGYPTHRRGYDFLLATGVFGKPKVIPIQLKSSNKGIDGAYHPNIRKLQEENFQDVDMRRLIAKIAAYKQWVASDYGADEASRVQKYILGTAKDSLALMDVESERPFVEVVSKQMAVAGLNRAARRRYARKQKKQ